MAFFNSRQKVFISTYTHFDINEIYKSKAGQLLLWIWIIKTKWVNEWCNKESYLYWIYSVAHDSFFTKNRYSWISHANLAIWWWKSSKVSSRSVFVFVCHLIILNNNYSWIFLCYFNNKKKNLLMIYWLYLQHLLDFIKLKTLWCNRLK